MEIRRCVIVAYSLSIGKSNYNVLSDLSTHNNYYAICAWHFTKTEKYPHTSLEKHLATDGI